MSTAFTILFLLSLFGLPLALLVGVIVFALSAMTDRTKESNRSAAHRMARAA
jgi:hypothetical protein